MGSLVLFLGPSILDIPFVYQHFCRSVAAAQCSKIDNMDFWGADIVKLADISSFQNCCNRCWKNKSCDRWTYSSATKRCWLKRATGWTKRPTEGKISGRVFRASSSSSLVPSPIPVPSPPPIPVPSLPNLGPIPSNGEYTKSNYGDVLGLSWLFYEAQRSGNLPANNRIPWRKSSHTQDIVPGGWYDAGDYLKLNFPLASVVSFLAWGMLEFKEGYQQAGQTQHALDNLYAAADYLRRCHIAPRKYIGQIGHPGMLNLNNSFTHFINETVAYFYTIKLALSDNTCAFNDLF